jgi:hypothetical protein
MPPNKSMHQLAAAARRPTGACSAFAFRREDMPLIEELEASGKWLFRWWSCLPLVMVIVIFASLKLSAVG